MTSETAAFQSEKGSSPSQLTSPSRVKRYAPSPRPLRTEGSTDRTVVPDGETYSFG